MTLPNASASPASNLLFPPILEGQRSVPRPSPIEELLPAESLAEAVLIEAQPVAEKVKRRRKTKSEYAAMPRPEPKEKDKHKGGRPELAEEEKLKCVSSLVSAACHDQLKATSVRHGISVSQAIRWLIDGPGTGRVRQRMKQLTKQGLSQEERKQLRSLAEMAANLNQLAKLAHAEGYVAHATAVMESAVKIRVQLKSFNK
ncbi:plasmid mobilization relaxosome protein MobC [Hymenobacter arizonensis]|uniref:Mobilisation protein (MobC) n=1 Tax=Hymenobacter arizonensis TaxID=1227077 RepID=A0A1I6BQD8_HYMAR|nr:plasmid mobilization relaxosome protein MobC [Hymenobacter arizonensis]SFQ83121.1 mobilisation protein (MobC) [Hymenobacter arizonensis]